MNLKTSTRRILKSASNIRTYPTSARNGAARRNAAKLLRALPREELRKIYLWK